MVFSLIGGNVQEASSRAPEDSVDSACTRHQRSRAYGVRAAVEENAMANEYPAPLPRGQVLCETCKQAGQKVEMERYDPNTPANGERTGAANDTELRTYRCPVCEDVSMFRVS
jgi:hypothetical protein